ncbi:hypothetical protein AC1031_014164 [Aphanomyces cochlioides]|nr:hypothetical protein AC1031_014164 [Aphanomyces cochlioides]
MLTLFCVVVGEGRPFPIEIDADKSVGILKKKIKEENKNTITCDAKDLQLYLALKGGLQLKDGAWLSDEDPDLKGLSQPADGNTVLPKYVNEERKMRETKKLSNYFSGGEDYPEYCDEKIHVVVTEQEALGVAPTTTHRHPERLKRWAAINAMIRQKNQQANQKTTDEDANTNKKRKKRDVNKTVGYSSLCWEDIKSIYNFEDSYDLQPNVSDIPDADIQLLLARIHDLRDLYGQVTDGKEAKRLFFIAPILETVSRLIKDVRILVEEDVAGKNVLLNGRFEFVLKRGKKRISLVEAKREDMQQGLVQSVTGLEALADVENLSVTYGIVTNFIEWTFVISEDTKARKHEYSLRTVETIPSFEGLKELVGRIYAMLMPSIEKEVCIVEAKKDDLLQGMAQDLLACEVQSE